MSQSSKAGSASLLSQALAKSKEAQTARHDSSLSSHSSGTGSGTKSTEKQPQHSTSHGSAGEPASATTKLQDKDVVEKGVCTCNIKRRSDGRLRHAEFFGDLDKDKSFCPVCDREENH
ncbi:hypothetical protein F5B20DRAFT_582047 [Whalleya microplaca]|nr:hypothetical protein F5B20DRAFT_582047 [Whalleya microplaca]